MLAYLVRRIGAALVVLFLISVFTYAVFFLLSPDPAYQICGKTCTPERIEQIHNTLGLNQPFWVQYWQFLSGIFGGRTFGTGADAIACDVPCLGFSFQTNQQVTAMVVARFPVTLTLAVGAGVLWLLFGIAGGLLAALKRGTWWDKGVLATALAGISLPNYKGHAHHHRQLDAELLRGAAPSVHLGGSTTVATVPLDGLVRRGPIEVVPNLHHAVDSACVRVRGHVLTDREDERD